MDTVFVPDELRFLNAHRDARTALTSLSHAERLIVREYAQYQLLEGLELHEVQAKILDLILTTGASGLTEFQAFHMPGEFVSIGWTSATLSALSEPYRGLPSDALRCEFLIQLSVVYHDTPDSRHAYRTAVCLIAVARTASKVLETAFERETLEATDEPVLPDLD